jgi:lipoprotein NlpD
LMRVLVGFLFILLTACSSNPPAPVVDRTPQSKPQPPTIKPTSKSTDALKDWRPDSHIVKKGDTLFGIGLEYGVDYKEIAAANNISPPYPIQIGQKLDLTSFKLKLYPLQKLVNQKMPRMKMVLSLRQ